MSNRLRLLGESEELLQGVQTHNKALRAANGTGEQRFQMPLISATLSQDNAAITQVRQVLKEL